MIRLSWIEIFLRLIPEMLAMIWGVLVISGKTISVKKYIGISCAMGVGTFLIRMLPIYFGVHTFILIALTIMLMCMINIPIVKATCGTLIMFFALTVSEFVNIAILNLFNINYNSEFLNPILKCILGIPSLIIMFLLVLVIKVVLSRRRLETD